MVFGSHFIQGKDTYSKIALLKRSFLDNQPLITIYCSTTEVFFQVSQLTTSNLISDSHWDLNGILDILIHPEDLRQGPGKNGKTIVRILTFGSLRRYGVNVDFCMLINVPIVVLKRLIPLFRHSMSLLVLLQQRRIPSTNGRCVNVIPGAMSMYVMFSSSLGQI